MSEPLSAKTFRASDLARRTILEFHYEPDTEARDALAKALEIEGIRKLRFEGELKPEGKSDWRLEGRLGATVVQACVVTLAPVVTRIDENVVRRYLADWSEPEPGSEIEMPEDDTTEALGGEIDIASVMAEALALALPGYPRAQGVEFGAEIFTEPGVEPLTDEKVHPFAELAKLKQDEGK